MVSEGCRRVARAVTAGYKRGHQIYNRGVDKGSKRITREEQQERHSGTRKGCNRGTSGVTEGSKRGNEGWGNGRVQQGG